MAGRLLALSSRFSIKRLVPFGAAGTHHDHGHGHDHGPSYDQELKALIGNREMVGFGLTGDPFYQDREDFPFPSLRWKENTPDILALREKEKGDWRKLTIEEKKAIYRSNFCQTFSELNAPTGEWKTILAGGLFFSTVGLWLFILLKLFICPPLPESFSEENQRAQLRRMLDARVGIISGISSKWDYEKDDWKKNV